MKRIKRKVFISAMISMIILIRYLVSLNTAKYVRIFTHISKNMTEIIYCSSSVITFAGSVGTSFSC